MSNNPYLTQFYVKLNGSDVDAEFLADLSILEVDDSLYLPAMATLQLNDPTLKWVDLAAVQIGAPLEIGVRAAGDRSNTKIFTGEITSIELDVANGGFQQTVVRAYDKSHRLMRMPATAVYLQMTDSDMITKGLQECGLTGAIAATANVYECVVQDNQTYFDFLQERLRRNGHVGKFTLNGQYKTGPADSMGTNVLEYKLGDQLVEFRPHLTAVSQLTQLMARGWDWKAKAAVVGTANSVPALTTVGYAPRAGGLASKFNSSPKTVVNTIVVDKQAEAEKVAQSLLSEQGTGDVQAEGVAIGDPGLLAGSKANITGVGTRFSGTYLITRAVHRYDGENYLTSFESNPSSSMTTSDMVLRGAGAVESDRHGSGLTFMPAIVTNNNDPENAGRVRVKYPLMGSTATGNEVESFWARVLTPMAGAGYGHMFVPEVNDEVLVGFDRGDVNHPYVIGALWNGKDAPPLKANVAVKSGKVVQRIIKTRSGHTLLFDDSDDAPRIEIQDKTQKNKIVIDSATNKIQIEADAAVTVKTKEVTVEGTQSVKITGGTNGVTIETQGRLTLKGSQGVAIDGGPSTEIKGGMVKLN